MAKKTRVEIELEIASKRAEVIDAMLGKLSALEEANRQNVAAAQAAQAAAAKLASENERLNLQLDGVKNSLAAQRAESRRLNAELDRQRTLTTATSKATATLAAENQKLQLTLEGARNSLAFQQAETRRLNAEVEKLRGYVGAAAMGLVKLADAQKQAGNATREATTRQKEQADTVDRTAVSFNMFSAVLRSAVVLAAYKAATALADTDQQLTRIQRTLLAITGSTQGAAAEMAFIRSEANRLGADLPTTAQAYARFVAAVSSSGLPMEEVRRIFTAFTEAGTALGLSSDELNGVFLALSQMFSKGTVQAEELRGQLGERLPGAFVDAANAMGMTTKELGKALEMGEVLASDLIPRLATLVQAKYAGALPSAMDSTTAAINRTSSAWFDFKTEINEIGGRDTIQTFVEAAGARLNLLTEKMKESRTELKGLYRDFLLGEGMFSIFGDSLIGSTIVARQNAEESAKALQETLARVAAAQAAMSGTPGAPAADGQPSGAPSKEEAEALRARRVQQAEFAKLAGKLPEIQERYHAALLETKTGTEQLAMLEKRRQEIETERGKSLSLVGLTEEQQREAIAGWNARDIELQTELLKIEKQKADIRKKQDSEIEKSVREAIDRVNDEREAQEKAQKAENELRQTGLEIARQQLAIKRAEIDANPRLNVNQKEGAKIALIKAELPLILQRVEALKREEELTRNDTAPEALTRRAEVLREINGLQQQYVANQAEANRLSAGFGERVGNSLMGWANQFGTVADGVAGIITGTLDAAISSVSSNITGLIMGTMTWGEAFANIANQIIAALINVVIQFAVQRAAIWALNKLFGVQELVFVSTQATAAAVAWAPAAIAASIASYGTAAAAGLAAYQGAMGAGMLSSAAGAAAAGASGIAAGAAYRKGGYTGDGPKDEVAGVVHRREVVIPAEITDRLGAANILGAVEAAAYGYSPPAEASAPTVNVAVPGRGGSSNFTLGVFDDRSGMSRWMRSREGRRAMIDMQRRTSFTTDLS